MTYLGCVNFTGISLIISRYMDCDTSGVQLLGNMGSLPLSIIFLSNNHLLNDSGGASIPVRKVSFKFPHFQSGPKVLIYFKEIRM